MTGFVGRSAQSIIIPQSNTIYWESPIGGVSGIARIVVPSGKIWRVKSLYGTFTTDATVLNRRIAVTMWDSSNTIIQQTPHQLAQTAGQAIQYSGLPSVPGLNSTVVQLTLPDVALLGGYKIGFANLAAFTGAAADAWTGLYAIVDDES